jgi:hypothetical protein
VVGQKNKVRGSKKAVGNNTKNNVRVLKKNKGVKKQEGVKKNKVVGQKNNVRGSKKAVENNTKNKVRGC